MERKKSYYIGLGICFVVLLGILLSSHRLVSFNSPAGYSLPKVYWLVIAALLLMVAVGGFVLLLLKKKPSIALCAAGIFLGMGLLYMVLLPPFSSPDERSHYMTSYVLSNYMLGEEVYSENGRVMVRECDLFSATGNLDDSYLSEHVGKIEIQYITEHLFAPTGNTQMVESDYDEDVHVNNMLARLPQALGLTAARVFGMNYLMSLFMGRFFGLAFFAVVFYFALRLLPKGKMVMASVGLLPMTVSQAASFSYDVLILSLCYLFISYTFHLKYQKGKITTVQAVMMVLLLAAFTPWKLTYAWMALLCLVLPSEKFTSKRAYYICAVSAVLAVAVAVLLVNVSFMGEMITGSDPSLDHADAEAYTFGYLMTHPIEFLELLRNTLWYQGEFYLQTMIGQFPGKLDIGLEIYDHTVVGFGLVTLISSVSVRGEEDLYDKRDKIVSAILCAGMIFLVVFSMAIGWTPVTSDYVQGVQGRYFLCVVPLILYFLQGKWLKLDKNWNYPLLFSTLVLHALALARIVERVSYR